MKQISKTERMDKMLVESDFDNKSQNSNVEDLSKVIYFSRKEMLEMTRDNRQITATPLGVHDLIIVQETDGLVALYINRRILPFLKNTKVSTIKTKDDIMYFRNYEVIKDLQKNEKIYELTDENLQFVVTYTNVRDEILNPIRKYLGTEVLCYSNVTLVFDNVSETLRFELLDTDGEIPIESAILSKKLLKITQNRYWLNETDISDNA